MKIITERRVGFIGSGGWGEVAKNYFCGGVEGRGRSLKKNTFTWNEFRRGMRMEYGHLNIYMTILYTNPSAFFPYIIYTIWYRTLTGSPFLYIRPFDTFFFLFNVSTTNNKQNIKEMEQNVNKWSYE